MAFTTPKTYAVGDVLTASDMNTYQRDNISHLNDDVQGTIEASQGMGVFTTETTTSTSYTNLSTAGPAVTATVRSTGRVLVAVTSSVSNSSSGETGLASFALTGANTVAAQDNNAVQSQAAAANNTQKSSVVSRLSGLTAGSTTFTMQYKVTGGTGSFGRRQIAVLPL